MTVLPVCLPAGIAACAVTAGVGEGLSASLPAEVPAKVPAEGRGAADAGDGRTELPGSADGPAGAPSRARIRCWSAAQDGSGGFPAPPRPKPSQSRTETFDPQETP